MFFAGFTYKLRLFSPIIKKPKIMTNTLVLLCLLASCVAGFSQEKSFNLNNYKFPNYKRHELELNFNSSGSKYKSTDKYFPSSGEMEKKEYLRSSNNSNLTLGYQYDCLTRKRIDYLSSTLEGIYDYSKFKDYNVENFHSNPHILWLLNGSSKYYLTENKFFLEGLTELHISWSKTKGSMTDQTGYNSNSNYQRLSVGLGLGVGRIEKVSDLWQAYYMLEKLNKQGSFTRQMTEDDVFEFARLASRLKNKRFFDARLHKIEELKGLDSLLHQQGLITESDISYFTTLNDYWSYGNFQDRHSGMELVFKASPNYQRSYSKTNYNNNTESNSFGSNSEIELSGMYSYIKQLNLYWQQGIGAGVSYESMLDSAGTYFSDVPDNRFFTHASLVYGYFPDSRTSISGSINYRGENIYIQSQQNSKEDAWRNTILLSLSGNYYISPQLQITGSVYFNYSDKTYTSLDNFNTNYNFGLRYAIF